jgi:hypothetical protein
MPGYVYRGTNTIKPRGASGGRPKTGLAPFNPDLCGTNAGYHQHYRHKQPACDPCLVGHQEYDAGYRAKRKAAGLTRAMTRRIPERSDPNED